MHQVRPISDSEIDSILTPDQRRDLAENFRILDVRDRDDEPPCVICAWVNPRTDMFALGSATALMRNRWPEAEELQIEAGGWRLARILRRWLRDWERHQRANSGRGSHRMMGGLSFNILDWER